MKSFQIDDITASVFFKQFALLISSGIPAGDALLVISEESESTEFSNLLKHASDLVKTGSYVSEALGALNLFSKKTIGFLRTGETVGRLENSLNSLENYYYNKHTRKKNLIDSITYPCILLFLMSLVIIVLVTYVLPIFNDVYVSLGSSFSGFASGLLLLGNIIKLSLPYIGITLSAIIFVIVFVILVPKANNFVKQKFLNICGDRGIYKKTNNAEFMLSLAVAVNSGMPMEEAVELCEDLFSDIPGAKKRCKNCLNLLKNGVQIEDALKATDFITSSSAYILKLGFRAGKGDELISEIANQAQLDVSNEINAKLSRIEPALVISASVITGIILLTVMLPLLDIMNTIG